MTQAAMMRTAYDDTGAGEPALLMVPGWCGGRTMFDPLTPLAGLRRRTVAVDLREHGESARTGADFSTADVVADLVAVMHELNVERVVPVAVAHAGWAAIELRRQLGPERVPGVVLLDWMTLGPPPEFLDALVGLQDERAWELVRSALFAMWTTGVDNEELRRFVASMGDYAFAYWRRAGREISAAFAAEGSPLAALERLDIACPTLHVYAQPRDEDFLAAQQAYAASHGWFRVHRLDAASHFPMFEVPGQMVNVIEDFVCSV